MVTMMNKYLVWDKSEGSEQKAKSIETSSPETAAEIFAEYDDIIDSVYGSFYGNGVSVCVKCPDKMIKIYNVTCDIQPSYYASPID